MVPLDAVVPLLVWPLLQLILQSKRSPSVSLIRMLQVRLRGWLVEVLRGVGVPKVGGMFCACVVKVYQARVYWLLPVGSVALTQIV